MEPEKAVILIVDDEPDIVDALSHFFTAKGYHAIGVATGEDALDVLATRKVDVVLLDIRLPGLQGTEVARIIRENYPQVKLIVITAYPEEGEKLGREVVLEGVLVKPVGVQELYDKMLAVLSRRESGVLDTRAPRGIKARVLFIKAKLLFVEPSPQMYQTLASAFSDLSKRGEAYEVIAAGNEAEVGDKLATFMPDLLLLNMLYLNTLTMDFIERISQSTHKPKEIIIYKPASDNSLSQEELARLVKTVQAYCLKNGLIEVQWIDI